MTLQKVLKPSAEFLKQYASRPRVLKYIEQMEKEFAIFSYLSDRVPSHLGDKEWTKMLETRTREERVKLWDFIALTQVREENDLARRDDRQAQMRELQEHQSKVFESGGMGYGAHFYRLLLDPMAQKKTDAEFVYEQRQCSVSILKDQPKIALDMQFIIDEKFATRQRLRQNVQYFVKENRTVLPRPFPLEFINVDPKDTLLANLINEIGFFNRTTRPPLFLPQIHADNPYKNLKRDAEEVVYISRHARDILDGPLQHDVYILPVSFDSLRQSIGAARSARIRPVALPIRKYIKWESGPMFLPLTGIQKVLYEVSKTGGDWESALRSNISIRHLEKNDSNVVKTHREVAKYRLQQRQQIIQAIDEAIPQQISLEPRTYAPLDKAYH